MTLAEDLIWRGQVKDHTFQDVDWLNEPKTFYLGTDASSDSLTIGNLAVYMLARRLAHAGWKTVLLVGGATSLVGDPGGKTEERELKSREDIEKHVKGLEKQVRHLLNGQPVTLVDNYHWFKDIGYLEFLRDVGKHYPMSELMQRDFVVERLGESGSGISYAEFSYSLIQGYDFWYLFKNHDVVLQIGGSDQWGNMLSGVPLVRKKENYEVHALSMPLVINKSTGQKFGKSEAGAIWLDERKTSVYQFYQFWLNVDDNGVGDYLKIYTELSRESIERIMQEFDDDRSSRLAQKALADEVTSLVHGKDNAEKAQLATKVIAEQTIIGEVDESIMHILRAEIPYAKASPSSPLADLLVVTGLATSNTEARRLVDEGAVYINGQTVRRDVLQDDDFKQGRAILRKGKALQNSALIELA